MTPPFRAWRARSAAHAPPAGRRRAGVAVVLGALTGAALLPSAWGWLVPLPLAWLFGTAARLPARPAGQAAFAFALGLFGVHLRWLPESFAVLFGPASALLFLPLVALLAGLWGAAAGLTRAYAGPRALWALPLAWVLLEWLRSLGPLGFTWGALGYALSGTPLVQAADLGGVPLLSALVGLSASALARWNPRALAVLAAAWALTFGYGLWQQARYSAPGPLRALLVQGRVDPQAKARGDAGDTLALYTRLTRAALRAQPADLVVWPETALAAPPTDPAVLAALRRLGTPLLTGAVTPAPAGSYNSVYAVSGRVLGRQDKRQLVPFGEFFPARQALRAVYDPLFAALGLPGLRGTRPGRASAPLTLGRLRAGLAVCYESTFPAISRRLVRRGANLLVTVSNDAWFGRTAGAEQHFLMGRVRAIETRRALLRAGNDGVTAAVTPGGQVTARLPRGARATLRAAFSLNDTLTPYVRLGDWPVLLSALTLALLGPWRWHASRFSAVR